MNLRKVSTANVAAKISLISLLSIFLVLSLAIANDKPNKITGTYTDLKLNRSSGDLIGHELRIVFSGKDYKGILQFADGEPSDIILVAVKVVGSKISFIIPKGLPDAGKFEGSFEPSGIRGTFTYQNGSSEKVYLKRGTSYWDK